MVVYVSACAANGDAETLAVLGVKVVRVMERCWPCVGCEDNTEDELARWQDEGGRC